MKEDNYLSQSYVLADIKYQKKELKAILKKKESTDIWKELADAYKMDIEVGATVYNQECLETANQ